MQETFTYEFGGERYGDEIYNCRDYEYTANNEDLEEAIIELVIGDCFSSEEYKQFTSKQKEIIFNAFKEFVDMSGDWDKWLNEYKQELKEHFEDLAYEEYINRR